MKFSLDWINRYTYLPVSDKTLIGIIINKIALQIVDVDEKWIYENNAVIDVDNKIITNRPYCFGHRGLAREIAVMLNQEYKSNYPLIPIISNIKNLEIEVKDPFLCPRYTSILIKNIKIGPSPDFLKNALESIGQRSINNIVDITNFIMFDTGQPVHAYDYNKIENGKIIIRRAKEGEKVVTLDGIERELNSDILLITDKIKVIGIAGVMGAQNSEIDDTTTSIVLEVASFSPYNIRQTAKTLKHRTDAVTRFEKGIDPTNIPNVMGYLIELITQECGGEVASEYLDINNLNQSTIRVNDLNINFNPQRIEKLLGFNIEINFIKRVFEDFGIKYTEVSDTEWILSVPPYRADIKENADLIEDIGRMFGYQNIPNTIPVNQLIIPKKNIKIEIKRKIQSALISSGLDEVITYSFISQMDVDSFDLKDSIRIINPLSEEYKYLRKSLIPSLTKIISSNTKHLDEFGIFEISRQFIRKQEKQLDYSEDKGTSMQPNEIEVISMMYVSKEKKENSIFCVKEAFENMMEILGLQRYALSIAHDNIYKNNHVFYKISNDGEIILMTNMKESKIGKLGFLSQKQLENYELKGPVAFLEIEFEPLINAYNDKPKFQSFSKFPGSKINYSILVSNQLKIEDIMDNLSPLNNSIINKVNVIDVYENSEQLGNKISYSIEFELQKMERNITDSEIYDIGIEIEKTFKLINTLEIRGGGVTKPKDYKSTNILINNLIAAEIKTIEKHPNADRLVITKVTTDGKNEYQIVTGANNIEIGDLVPVALPGTEIPNLFNKDGTKVIMKVTPLRGVDSYGMMLAGDELGINDDHEGIFILNKEAFKIGDIINPKDL